MMGRSPLMMTAESFYRHSPIIAPGGYNSPGLVGRSPYSNRLSEFSTPDRMSFTTDAANKIASQKKLSLLWRLAKMNIQEWPCAIGGCIASMVNGAIFASFSYILGVTLGAYYITDHASMIREITKICYVLIGLSATGFMVTLMQCSLWDITAENLIKRLREKLLAAVVRNDMGWFDQEENESSKLSVRLALDSNHIRAAAAAEISTIIQNCTLMLVACAAALVLQWRLTLIIITVFPFIVGSAFLQVSSVSRI